MIPLMDGYDYAIMLGVAALCGALGGFVFELLQRRDGNPGKIEVPWKPKRGSFYDLGWIASVIIGAAAAVAVLYFFPPTLSIDTGGQTTLRYDLVKLVALSLIVGSAGGSFLSAMQAQVLATLNEQKVQSTRALAENEFRQLGQAAKAETEVAVRSALEKTQTQLEKVLQEATRETPPALAAQLSGSSAIPEGLKDYVEAHPPETDPEEKSRKIQTLLATVAEDASESLGERMEKRIDAARTTLSSVANAPAVAPAGASGPAQANVRAAS